MFPFTSEVTLLTDKDQAIPVQVVRSGVRSVAYGRGQSGVLDLRFIAANADIQMGDVLVTSGIDGIYPAGLAVAKVLSGRAQVAPTHSPASSASRWPASTATSQFLILLNEPKTAAARRAPEEHKKRKGRRRSG